VANRKHWVFDFGYSNAREPNAIPPAERVSMSACAFQSTAKYKCFLAKEDV
jgi:hypothetical protein